MTQEFRQSLGPIIENYQSYLQLMSCLTMIGIGIAAYFGMTGGGNGGERH